MDFTFPSALPALKSQSVQTKECIRQIATFIKELHIDLRNKHVLLAVSGGADSLALLCFWQWYSVINPCSITVLHINHTLRPESEQEALFVSQLCTAWNIPHYIEKCDINALAQKNKQGIEETARKVRYELYEQYRGKCQAAWVCLGHHLHDVQEDVFMRLIRGTGWPALGGMVALDEKRHILRPLLMQEPLNLRQILQDVGLSFAEDASNADIKFFRNRVRHTFLPLFHAENPAFSQKIQELWHMAQYDAAHWQEYLNNICQEHKIQCEQSSVHLSAQFLKKLNKATRLRLYMHAISLLKEDIPKMQGQARAQTLFALDVALIEGRGNTHFQLPGNISAYLQKGSITFKFSGIK